MTTQDKLPQVPSELLELAIANTESLDRTKYVPHGVFYHEAFKSDHMCHVCQAGAVIANTFGAPHTKGLTPYKLLREGTITHQDMLALQAIDKARTGLWHTFLTLLRIDEQTPENNAMLKDLMGEQVPSPTFTNWEELLEHTGYLKRCVQILKTHGH